MLIKRTTLRLNQELYKLAKKRAVDEESNFQDLVNKALARYLKIEKKVSREQKGRFEFGSFDLGGLKGKIDRESIYAQRAKKSFT